MLNTVKLYKIMRKVVTEKQQEIYLYFTDFVKAFDQAEHDILIETLLKSMCM